MTEKLYRILLFTDSSGVGWRYGALMDQLELQSGGCAKRYSDDLTVIPIRDWFNHLTPARLIEALAKYKEHENNDLLLVLTPAQKADCDALLMVTKSGLLIVGPNDGCLKAIDAQDIVKVWKLEQPWFHNEFSRRIYAAGKIAKGESFDGLGSQINKEEIIRQ